MKRALLLITLSCLAVSIVTAQVNVNRNPQAHKVAEIYNEGSMRGFFSTSKSPAVPFQPHSPSVD